MTTSTFEKTEPVVSTIDIRNRRRITATESIAGRRCIITLEKDEKGQYREVEIAMLDG